MNFLLVHAIYVQACENLTATNLTWSCDQLPEGITLPNEGVSLPNEINSDDVNKSMAVLIQLATVNGTSWLKSERRDFERWHSKVVNFVFETFDLLLHNPCCHFLSSGCKLDGQR